MGGAGTPFPLPTWCYVHVPAKSLIRNKYKGRHCLHLPLHSFSSFQNHPWIASKSLKWKFNNQFITEREHCLTPKKNRTQNNSKWIASNFRKTRICNFIYICIITKETGTYQVLPSDVQCDICYFNDRQYHNTLIKQRMKHQYMFLHFYRQE